MFLQQQHIIRATKPKKKAAYIETYKETVYVETGVCLKLVHFIGLLTNATLSDQYLTLQS